MIVVLRDLASHGVKACNNNKMTEQASISKMNEALREASKIPNEERMQSNEKLILDNLIAS